MKDTFRLTRFIEAQSRIYQQARSELAAGDKRTHWMWFVFPQIGGLGSSPTARHFAISGLAEAQAYLQHPLLGRRLLDCTSTVNGLDDALTARAIFSSPDDLKFHSSMTLFSYAAIQGDSDPTPFQTALKRYFGGNPDLRTLDLLKPALGRLAALHAATGGR
ncbi:DUF1810 domain-containing protein [Rhizobiaceae bacterium CRRU44]|uniref:DUF1810 domain-containing protein n=1 Tax=Ferranicluibacter rubi TaxID=2715133 RepID=A0AA43ZDF6_9HYPH|nr:DUF1810 domain-containing protein [Ferranicluibacter rubi]NHT74476.1 DUF1810 domain-containing protein [Ferranicluibacter rubi]